MSFSDNREPDEAQSRIDRIRGGSSQPAPQQPAYDEPEPTPRSSRAGQVASQPSGGAARGGMGRGTQALLVIGGVVVIGILIVLALILISGPGSSISIFATETPTPTLTFTPTATSTPTATPTPTPEPPELALPPFTCIFQSGTGCSDYCSDAENADECDQARSFIENQGADFDVWIQCVAPSSGPNTGNPQDCLIEAWYANLDSGSVD